jgi:hypothetical protein
MGDLKGQFDAVAAGVMGEEFEIPSQIACGHEWGDWQQPPPTGPYEAYSYTMRVCSTCQKTDLAPLYKAILIPEALRHLLHLPKTSPGADCGNPCARHDLCEWEKGIDGPGTGGFGVLTQAKLFNLPFPEGLVKHWEWWEAQDGKVHGYVLSEVPGDQTPHIGVVHPEHGQVTMCGLEVAGDLDYTKGIADVCLTCGKVEFELETQTLTPLLFNAMAAKDADWMQGAIKGNMAVSAQPLEVTIVGESEKGPVSEPVHVTSFDQLTDLFGEVTAKVKTQSSAPGDPDYCDHCSGEGKVYIEHPLKPGVPMSSFICPVCQLDLMDVKGNPVDDDNVIQTGDGHRHAKILGGVGDTHCECDWAEDSDAIPTSIYKGQGIGMKIISPLTCPVCIMSLYCADDLNGVVTAEYVAKMVMPGAKKMLKGQDPKPPSLAEIMAVQPMTGGPSLFQQVEYEDVIAPPQPVPYGANVSLTCHESGDITVTAGGQKYEFESVDDLLDPKHDLPFSVKLVEPYPGHQQIALGDPEPEPKKKPFTFPKSVQDALPKVTFTKVHPGMEGDSVADVIAKEILTQQDQKYIEMIQAVQHGITTTSTEDIEPLTMDKLQEEIEKITGKPLGEPDQLVFKVEPIEPVSKTLKAGWTMSTEDLKAELFKALAPKTAVHVHMSFLTIVKTTLTIHGVVGSEEAQELRAKCKAACLPFIEPVLWESPEVQGLFVEAIHATHILDHCTPAVNGPGPCMYCSEDFQMMQLDTDGHCPACALELVDGDDTPESHFEEGMAGDQPWHNPTSECAIHGCDNAMGWKDGAPTKYCDHHTEIKAALHTPVPGCFTCGIELYPATTVVKTNSKTGDQIKVCPMCNDKMEYAAVAEKSEDDMLKAVADIAKQGQTPYPCVQCNVNDATYVVHEPEHTKGPTCAACIHVVMTMYGNVSYAAIAATPAITSPVTKVDTQKFTATGKKMTEFDGPPEPTLQEEVTEALHWLGTD